MTKFRRIITLLLCIFLLTGCAQKQKFKNPKYKLVQENGNYYIILDDDLYERAHSRTGSVRTSVMESVLHFSSVSEMKRRIMNGDFTDEELLQIAGFDRTADGKTIVLDLDNLYIPTFPDCLEITKITWTGKSYYYILTNKTTGDRFLVTTDADAYSSGMHSIAREQTNAIAQKGVTVSLDAERNATVYSYISSSNGNTINKYFYECDVHLYQVFEQEEIAPNGERYYSFDLCRFYSYYSGGNYISGNLYVSSLNKLSEPLTEEFITSFGITRYED